MAEQEEQAATSPAASRVSRLRAHGSRWFEVLSPWGSLALSAWGALGMDRGEGEGAWVVGLSALSFVALSALALVNHAPANAPRPHGRLAALLRFGALSGSQSLIQRSLLFSLPFYVQAAAFTAPQLLFLALFAVATAVSLWDPWSERLLLHPVGGAAQLAFASFVAWNAALPMLGVPHRLAIWGAAAAVALGVPLVLLLRHRQHPERLRIAAAGVLVPGLLALFGVQLLPAAPFKVVEMGIGTAVVERALVGASAQLPSDTRALYCLSAVFEPRGLHDALVHAWFHDGAELGRTELAVRGGRKRGFRTWSRRDLPAHAAGHYRCEVRTALGQTLAVREVVLR
jgi:Protein of unknown function (DUF2914)